MNWLHKNKTTWRITFLILLVLAITGPWAYDRINVPSQYPCSLPNVRLDENFCGLPLSITWILPYFFAEILYLVTSQGSEAIGIADAGRQALFMVSIGLILLSPLSTLLILLFGDRKCGVLFHRVG